MMLTIEQQRQAIGTESSTSARVRVTDPYGHIGVQELRRSYGVPRELGEGARRGIRRFGNALEQLAGE